MTLRGFLLLWGHAASRALRGRRGLALLFLAALPVVLAWIQVQHGRHLSETAFVAVTLMFVFQFVVPVAGLFLGVAVLGDEIEGRTITYLFTRPIPRPLVFLASYLGAVSAFAPLLAIAVGAMAHIFGTRVPVTGRDAVASAGIAVAGFVVYTAIFATLRLYFQRALFIGFIFGFIVEGAISKLPESGISSWSVWHHLALLEVRLFDGRLPGQHLRHLLQSIAPDETVAGSVAVLATVLAVALVIGMLQIRAQETRLANAST
ncbi:MAG TPA: ABC transporter permease [Planctomycetota bacterium]|nr:ABC transporter permease [Planctomycetota bacterium]